MNIQQDTSLEVGMNNMNLRPSYNPSPLYNQPPSFSGEWAQNLFRDNEEEEEEDDQPLSYPTNFSQPHIRNMANNIQSVRHPNFIKPATQSIPQASLIPADMRVIQTLYENYSQKVYYEGYLYKKNDLTVDGKSFGDPRWSKWYVELCGPVLTLWDTESEDENVMPQYINIADSSLELVGQLPQERHRQKVFSLNTAGANRYLIDVTEQNTMMEWVRAIRLSCFECSKIHEIYTLAFLSRPVYTELLSKQMNKMEGFVQVRFSNSTEWQKYWVVVSDRKDEKKLFGKKSVPSKGNIMFYESKKAKSPVLTMTNIVQAYTIYPESPQLIDCATLFKIEGMLSPKNSNEQPAVYCNALVMASTSRELVQWIVGAYDVFKLYGRPSRLLDDPSNPKSLNFGVSNNHNNPRLFLDLPEISEVNVAEDGLLENKASFIHILHDKLSNGRDTSSTYQPSMGLIHQIPSPATGLIHQIPSSASLYSNRSGNRLSNPPAATSHASLLPPQQPRTPVPAGRVIYASDEDSEEEGEEFVSESEDGSIYRRQDQKQSEITLPGIQVPDDGFADSILSGIAPKITKPPPQPIETKSESTVPPSVSSTEEKEPQHEDLTDDEDELFNSDEEERRDPAAGLSGTARPKPKNTKTQVSLSGTEDEEASDEDDINSYTGSEEEEEEEEEDDDDVPINQRSRLNNEEQYPPMTGYDMPQYGMMTPEMFESMDPYMQQQYLMQQQQGGYYGEYDDNGYPLENEDGPIIPQLGDRFATQNSLLDTFRPDHPSARDQEGYARATGQPLIQVPNKPPEPRAGLVGMISQLEYEKKQKESKNRLLDMEKDRILERERERYLLEQRYQMMPMMMQNPSMMDQSMMANGGMMQNPMMDPRMMMMGQMNMMNMMGQPMMYPNMMGQPMMQNPMMQQPMMQNPMMQPMMNMGGMPMMNQQMMMMNPYSQYPMWNQQAGFNRFSGHIPSDDDDEDDDVPLGAKDPPRPTQ
ncbi:hypothetical protein BDB01DRAFT_897080 [Pilobolus umbonatus]|nr:hypothetical protein BDB01DRAFT_897080 [Pilobolus umbonatus]